MTPALRSDERGCATLVFALSSWIMPFRPVMGSVTMAALGALASSSLAAQPSNAGADSVAQNNLESLRHAQARASAIAADSGFARGLLSSTTDDIILLLDGSPIVGGREAVQRLLAARAGLESLRTEWRPFRVLVSADGRLGVTFGVSVAWVDARGAVAVDRYVSVWTRQYSDDWNLAAHVETGTRGTSPPNSPTAAVSGIANERPGDEFVRADLDFARLASDSGAPAAFAHFVAADGMTFAPTGELNIGPSAVRSRLAQSRVGTAAWRWWPVVSFAAGSRDLGVTVGNAEIQLPGGEATFYSKYVTVWLRQPDGSLKFVVDAGNSRQPQ